MTTKKQLPTNNTKKQTTIEKRIGAEKKLFLETIEKIPVISIACKKSGVSRATFYRWKEDDPEFALTAANTLGEGTLAINELAKSKLIEMISQSNLSATIFWLKCHDTEFTEKRSMSIEHYNKMNEPISEKTENAIRKTMFNFNKAKGMNRPSFDGNRDKK